MSFYLYTDAAKTQPVILANCTAGDIGLNASQWSNMENSKIVDAALGTLYKNTMVDSSLTWARTISFSNEMIPAERYSALYNTAGYKINFGITKTGEGQYSLNNCGQITKPDGTVWQGGYTGTWTQTDPRGSKDLKIAIIKFSYVYGANSRSGYMFAPCYVQVRSSTPPEVLLILTFNGQIWLSENFLSQSVLDPTGGIPQQPEGGDGTFSAPSDTLTPLTAAELSLAMGGGGITAAGHGIHAYELSTANVSEFLQKIYGQGTDTFSDLWQQFQNYQYDPMSGIIGALILPCTATGTGVPAVTLSGQGIIITGGVKAITDRFASTNLCIIDCTNKVYDSFMDFEPYTKGTLYLPFIGNVSVNVNEFMYGYIEIYYTIDICTGNCVAFVTMRDKNNVHTQYTYSGNCGTPVPISGNDRGMAALINGTAGIFGGAVSLGAGIGLSNAGLAAKGALSIMGGIGQVGMRQEHEKHTGGFGGGTGCMGYLTPFLMLNRPVVSTPQNYTDLVGRMANQSQTVGAYSGYTEFDFVDLSGVDKLTDSEIEEVQKILESGIYL